MKLIEKTIELEELKLMAEKNMFSLVKAVVDIKKELMVVEMEMHADAERFLLERDSQQRDLWGINLYPEKYGSEEFIEYDSMINLRPNDGNVSRGVDNEKIRRKVKEVVKKLVKNE